MPIRPELRRFYRRDWYALRQTLLAAHGTVCDNCRRPHPGLNLAHLSHDPRDRDHLALLCPSCHVRNDTPQRIAITRRTRARRCGQLWLSAELEWAPEPLWRWPDLARQLDLF